MQLPTNHKTACVRDKYYVMFLNWKQGFERWKLFKRLKSNFKKNDFVWLKLSNEALQFCKHYFFLLKDSRSLFTGWNCWTYSGRKSSITLKVEFWKSEPLFWRFGVVHLHSCCRLLFQSWVFTFQRFVHVIFKLENQWSALIWNSRSLLSEATFTLLRFLLKTQTRIRLELPLAPF